MLQMGKLRTGNGNDLSKAAQCLGESGFCDTVIPLPQTRELTKDASSSLSAVPASLRPVPVV